MACEHITMAVEIRDKILEDICDEYTVMPHIAQEWYNQYIREAKDKIGSACHEATKSGYKGFVAIHVAQSKYAKDKLHELYGRNSR